MTRISGDELKQGVLIVADGGATDNQNEELRLGYGSFVVLVDGELIPSTHDEIIAFQHEFFFGNTTNNVAEHKMLVHALRYAQDLVARYKKAKKELPIIRIGMDSENALYHASGKFKVTKKGAHLKDDVTIAREILTALGDKVQLVKMDEKQIKNILGH